MAQPPPVSTPNHDSGDVHEPLWRLVRNTRQITQLARGGHDEPQPKSARRRHLERRRDRISGHKSPQTLHPAHGFRAVGPGKTGWLYSALLAQTVAITSTIPYSGV